jgi:hypothetical protein
MIGMDRLLGALLRNHSLIGHRLVQVRRRQLIDENRSTNLQSGPGAFDATKKDGFGGDH